MELQPNRIYFPGNPYPKGHPIVEFLWAGRIEEDETCWFDFHLKTDDYYAEDKSNNIEEPPSDWEAKGAWKNYHTCTLSSVKWGEKKGVKIGDLTQKLDFDQVVQHELTADLLPLSGDWQYDKLETMNSGMILSPFFKG
ncbi:MAG: hypothetical protein AAGI38_04105 [Bacteroidota bacterium]